MSCSEIRDWLGPYVDCEVLSETRQAVETHVAACASCATALEAMNRLAAALAPRGDEAPPPGLWDTIEQRLDETRVRCPASLRLRRRGFAAAAVVLLAVGLGLFSLQWSTPVAEAGAVSFSVLLDEMAFDPHRALTNFLARYDAQVILPARAADHGRGLSFAIPETLPGGFRLVATYAIRFGSRPGVAARYDRAGELLGLVFHPPVLREDFGTHEDRDCVVGQHRGHAVAVGEWSLVHVTDATTCRCILSRLDHDTELPAVVAAIAPGLATQEADGHSGQR